MNRDFYKRPIQGHSRSAHDYGNTHLGAGERKPHGTGIVLAATIAMIVYVAIWWLA